MASRAFAKFRSMRSAFGNSWQQRVSRRGDSWWGAMDGGVTEAVFQDTDTERIARWGLRMNLENTYLNWTRNSIISTVAGCAMIQYKVQQTGAKRMPLSGVGFLLLGFSFMTLGSLNYMYSYWQLRSLLRVSKYSAVFIGMNGMLIPSLWISSVYFFVNGAPKMLSNYLEVLHKQAMLPKGLTHPAPSTSWSIGEVAAGERH
mmetsp:Transcript_47941/g.113968  ORF Transcript_47941/g.113968 Transcript_47941/m.113968 type:complete len:202 (+) Transcript_47941:96-701(+)|eukprot:CAMPEP_0178425508 /NCGR_PEP_ID=MMETSP0689_2-20121128/28759_1 /TAXON_ID=160604 /ORGANISM="Amphidinium massartii, Strain CS-259" /LENGTH=201 /DNA_ID=CAMNT_0020047173 /DNA_START=60 /DNA_END=665 /DNA_ORIENTATION=+